MNVPIKLQMYIDEILEQKHTPDEWLDLEKEVNAYIVELPVLHQDYFAESGAGEALYMICSGIRLQA